MKAKGWKVYRFAVEGEDGQRRWDEAYQFLLRCIVENREKSHESEQEERNGSGTVCSCINHTTTTGSDH